MCPERLTPVFMSVVYPVLLTSIVYAEDAAMLPKYALPHALVTTVLEYPARESITVAPGTETALTSCTDINTEFEVAGAR